VTTVSAGSDHSLLFDYGGFPAETYKYQYPAPGSPKLAKRIQKLLADSGLPCDTDAKRGWDHGVFVPLMLLSPGANIPVVALSVLASQNAQEHVEVGEALQHLRNEGVLIVGSGVSFHNMQLFFAQGSARSRGEAESQKFDNWLRDTVTSQKYTDSLRRERMVAWNSQAESARSAHPQNAAEHLMPLFVIFGAAGGGPAGRRVGEERSSPSNSMSKLSKVPGKGSAGRADDMLAGFRISQFEFS